MRMFLHSFFIGQSSGSGFAREYIDSEVFRHLVSCNGMFQVSTCEKERRQLSVLRASGYSVAEMLVVVAFVIVLGAMATVNLISARQGFRAENALQTVVGQLRLAREIAVDQRLDVVVTFTLPNSFTIQRVDPGKNVVLVNTVVLPSDFQFMIFQGMPDTPDGFGNAAPVAFGDAMAIWFRPDGRGVDANLAPVNGSIYFANPDQQQTLRAVTLLGATGQIRSFRWTGSQWK